jgi:hypothetical protein
MAYYTALISAWNTGTVPNGVTGSALTGQTTAQKLININGWTVTGSVPTTLYVTGNQLLNCINWTEFNALTAAQQTNLLQLCAIPGQLLGGSDNTGFVPDGMLLAYFTNHSGPTILALTALAKAAVTPWWQAPVSPGPGAGLVSPVSPTDLAAAGGLS